MACASTVAVVVPSPATSDVLLATSRTICAPMFSSAILQIDLLRDGHAVLGDRRRSEVLADDDVAPLRPERDLDRVGQLIDAAEHRRRDEIAVDDLLGHDYFFF